jgi:hypothetical protein
MRRCLVAWSVGLVAACSADSSMSETVAALSASPVTTYVGEQNAQFGVSVATGDIDGDGYIDAVVTAPTDNWGPVDCLGALYAFAGPVSGSANSWQARWGTLCPSQLAGAFDFGVALAVGDINGDGTDDVVVGAPAGMDATNHQTGAVYVYIGANTVWDQLPLQATLTGTFDGGRFGAAVAIGDVDGDGRNDVIVGAPADGAGVIRAYRSLGSAWLSSTPTSITQGATGDQLGAALAVADFNGDGYGDVLAGAPNATQKGSAVVFAGASTGLTSTTLWSTTGTSAFGRFGSTVAIADLGGDTRPDIAVGAPSAQSGSVQIFINAANSISTTAAATVSRGTNGARFGASIAATDTDADGRVDLVVGAPLAGGSGAVHVFRGTASGIATTPYATRTGGANSQLGASVATADFDGDGLGDVLVGAVGVNQAYVYGGADCWQQAFYADADGDGWGLASDMVFACAAAPPAGRVTTSGDCDDSNSGAHPEATEIVGDSIDEDCDTREQCFTDDDNDGRIMPYPGISLDTDCLDPYEGAIGDPLDCDDHNPGTPIEVCDNLNADEDCDGLADDADNDATGKLTFYVDADGDGYGSAQVLRCDSAAGYVALGGDCDDTDSARSPAATELPGDSIDTNCDGNELCFTDADADGYRPDATSTIASVDADCTDAGEAAASTPTMDCDDAVATTHPGATEVAADGVDSDCDTAELCFVDADGDGYRPDAASVIRSSDLDCNDAAEAPATAPTTDCNDASELTHPGAVETCNGIDDDCDGVIDPIAVCPPVDDPTQDSSRSGCTATGHDARGNLVVVLLAALICRRRRASSRTDALTAR